MPDVIAISGEVADAIKPYADEIEADFVIDAEVENIKEADASMQPDIDINTSKKPFYTIEEKMLVVEMIRRNGGTITKQIINQARIMLRSMSVGDTVLRNWWNKYKDVPPAEIAKKAYGEWVTPKELVAKGIDPKVAIMREQASKNLDNMFEQIVETYLFRALQPDVVKETKGRDAVWMAAVATDKMRLLRNVSSEIIDILPSIIDLMKRKKIDPVQAFKDMYAALLRE